jgi:hypothetical protein
MTAKAAASCLVKDPAAVASFALMAAWNALQNKPANATTVPRVDVATGPVDNLLAGRPDRHNRRSAAWETPIFKKVVRRGGCVGTVAFFLFLAFNSPFSILTSQLSCVTCLFRPAICRVSHRWMCVAILLRSHLPSHYLLCKLWGDSSATAN